MLKDLPKIAWPTLIIFLVSFLGFFINIILVKNGLYSMLFGYLISTLLLYISFVPFHDGSHSSVFNKVPMAKWLNKIVGSLSGLLLLAPLPIFKSQHNIHHAHVNNPEKDPDFWVKGDNIFVIFLKMFTLFFRYYYLYITGNHRNKFTTIIIYNCIFALIFMGLSNYSSLPIMISLWVFPMITAMLLLALVFDYLPHYPHDDQSRYNNSKSIPNKFLKWIMLYQNYHIIHHLSPRIPFYLYEKSYYDLLKDKPGEHTRIIN